MLTLVIAWASNDFHSWSLICFILLFLFLHHLFCEENLRHSGCLQYYLNLQCGALGLQWCGYSHGEESCCYTHTGRLLFWKAVELNITGWKYCEVIWSYTSSGGLLLWKAWAIQQLGYFYCEGSWSHRIVILVLVKIWIFLFSTMLTHFSSFFVFVFVCNFNVSSST